MAGKKKTTKAATATERQAFRKRMLQAAGAGFLLMLWGFVLGILVGRGTLPTVVPMDPAVANSDRPLIVAEKSPGKTKVKDPDLDFYQSLAKKRQELAKQEAAAAKAAEPVTKTPAPSAAAKAENEPEKVASASPITKAKPPKIKVAPVKETAPAVKPPPAKKVTVKPARQPVKPPSPVANAEEQKPAPPKKAATTTGATIASGGKWAVQVAAFRNPAEALAYAKKISKTTGLPYRVTKVKLKNKGTWHRVRLGSFQSKSQATKASRNLKKKGLSTMIVSL